MANPNLAAKFASSPASRAQELIDLPHRTAYAEVIQSSGKERARGTLSPYTPGTKTNVLFFTKGEPTKQLWLYDARANVPTITKTSRPLTSSYFAEFERCFDDEPNGRARRAESDSADDRWRSFGIDEIIERGYKIDSFKWLRDEELDDLDEILDPAELVTDAMAELQAAVAEPHELRKLLDHTDIAGGWTEKRPTVYLSAGRWRRWLTLPSVASARCWTSGRTAATLGLTCGIPMSSGGASTSMTPRDADRSRRAR